MLWRIWVGPVPRLLSRGSLYTRSMTRGEQSNMSTEKSRAEDARRQARNFFAKDNDKEAAAEKERLKAEAALDAKTARLKALRLAKEAADREAAAAKKAATASKRTTS